MSEGGAELFLLVRGSETESHCYYWYSSLSPLGRLSQDSEGEEFLG